MSAWADMVRRFDAPDGLSVLQVGRHLGTRDFAGRLVVNQGRDGLMPIAKTLGWLARRGHLRMYEVKGRKRYVSTGM